jgi:hypothetical protein
MAADGASGEGGHPVVGDERGVEELAHALVLEGVDCINQASDLLGDCEARTELKGHADALTEIGRRLSAVPAKRFSRER